MDGNARKTDSKAYFVTLDELIFDYPGTTMDDWLALAEGVNVQFHRTRVPNVNCSVSRITVALLEEDVIKIEEAYGLSTYQDPEVEDSIADVSIERADDSIISADLLARSLKVRTKNLIRTAKELGLEVKVYDFGPGPNTVGFNTDQAEILRQHEKDRATKFATEDIYSIATVRKKLGTGVEKTFKLLDDLKITPGTYLFGKRRSEGLGITQSEFELLKAEVERLAIPNAPSDVSAVNRIAPTLKMGPKTLKKLANGAGIEPGRYLFNGVAGYGYSKGQLESVRQAYLPFQTSR